MAVKRRDSSSGVKFFVVLIIIIATLLFWGILGGDESKKVGVTCDFGMKVANWNLCWIWHTNIVGQVQEGINDLENPET